MTDIRSLPVIATSHRPAPKKIVRPCDYQLQSAVIALETQVGTAEAYNRLCDAAAVLKRQIDDGKAKAQNPLFATDPKAIFPLG